MSRRASFLDRDGVLNEPRVLDSRPYPPRDVHELVIPGDIGAGLRELRRAGFLLIIVTNQPDIARGTLSIEQVERVHDELRARLDIDDVYVCAHDTADGCRCRKPLPGMILDAAAEHDVDLAASWTIGDRWVDIAAGRAAGTRTALIERPWSWEPTTAGTPPRDIRPDFVCADLRASIACIVSAAE